MGVGADILCCGRLGWKEWDWGATAVTTMGSAPGCEVVLNGRRCLYFAGTGYLGLQGHPALVAAAQDGAARYGIHSATTRSGFGNSPPVLEVEERAARFLQVDAACYLVSGYAGNFAIAAALADQVDLALLDEGAHDCLREATRWLAALGRPPLVFRHRDANHLAELLQIHARAGDRALVMTDGVFAASGRLAPLADHLSVLGGYEGSMLLVDDAHGLATLGSAGRGSLELTGIAPTRINADVATPSAAPRVFHSSTLSKAIGGHGGIVAGSAGFLERVRGSSGWFRGASAPAAPVAAATAKGLEIIVAEPALRQQLADNVAQARAKLAALSLDVESSPSPIIGICWRDAGEMQRVQRQLLDDGIAISYTRDYAGSGPEGLLRIAIFATHTPAMIDRLTDVLARAL